MLRRLIAMVAALTATAALAPSAHASTRFVFATERGGPAYVGVDSSSAHTRLELTRGGVLVAHSAIDELDIAGLVEGDVATLYSGEAPIASAAYTPLPAIDETACIGRSAFGVRRAPGAMVIDAGAYAYDQQLASAWTAGESATVTLERPLRLGDVAYALTRELVGSVEIVSHRAVPVLDCRLPEVGPVVVPPPVRVAPPPSGPTDQQARAALKGSVGATGSGLRALRLKRLARRAAVNLPFAFPEPGVVTLELVAKGKAIGTGTKTSTANGRFDVAMKLTAAGRKLFKRATRLKLTLRATFTPSRAGGSPRRASVRVTLRR